MVFGYGHKKAWKRRLSVPRVEALALPSKLNRQRQSPRRYDTSSPVQHACEKGMSPSFDCRNGNRIPQALLAREVGIKSYPRASTVAMFKTLIGEFARFDSSRTKRQVNAFNMSLNYVFPPNLNCLRWRIHIAGGRCCSAWAFACPAHGFSEGKLPRSGDNHL